MIFKRKGRSRLEDIRIMNELFPAADAIAAADGEPDAGAEHLLIAALDLDTRVGATSVRTSRRRP